jgi:hypothetical protein
VVLALLWTTLALAGDHTHDPGTAQAAAAYATADQTRTIALGKQGLHPVIWEDIPAPDAREQLMAALTIADRFTSEERAIAFPPSVRCDLKRLVQASEELKAAESKMVQESWAGSFSHASLKSYSDATSRRAAADFRLKQDVGLRPRILLINYLPAPC